ncbi:MAG: hypothetical protein ACE5FP_04065 [Gemmatimonadota bacterium]
MSAPIHRFTAIGRPIDRRYGSNRTITTLTLLVAMGGFLILRLVGEPPPASFLRGLTLAIGFFLAWAIARELDPDHDAAAFVAALLSLIPLAALERPDFAAVFLVLLTLRIVNRTVGPAARMLDTIVILALVGIAAWRGHVAIVAAAAVAFALDAFLHPRHPVHLAGAVASLGLVAVAWMNLDVVFPDAWGAFTWLALVASLPFLFLIHVSGTPRSLSDAGGVRLSGDRVRAAQSLAFLLVAVIFMTDGLAGLATLSPLWAALAGTGLYTTVSVVGSGRD